MGSLTASVEMGLQGAADWYSEANRSLTWSVVLTYGSIFAGTWLTYSFLIKPFLSPLRKIPGMPYNPIFGSMRQFMRGEAMEESINFIKTFGPLVRYYFFGGGERLLVADPDFFKRIMVTNSRNYVKPDSRMKILRWVLGSTGLVSINGKEHLMKRKIMNPAFSYTSVRKMLPVFLTKSRLLRDNWIQSIDEAKEEFAECDVQIDLTHLTLDVIGEAGFSYQFDTLRGKSSEANDAFTKLLTGFDLSWMFIALPFYNKLPVPEVRAVKHYLGVIDKTVKDVISRKEQLLQKEGEEGRDRVEKDLLGMLMTARTEDGEGLSTKELRDQVVTFLFAGHETTSVGLAWCLLTLAQNPDIQDKLRAEIRQQTSDPGQQLDWEDVDKMEYLDCVVKETLRMTPPVPLVLRQAVHDDYLGEHYIPAGTILLLATGAMMRRPEIWAEPNKFYPERFLEETTVNPYTWLPFVQGPRMCIGYKFALLEMKLVLTVLLRDLKFSVIPGIKYKRKQRITMRPEPNLKLRVARV